MDFRPCIDIHNGSVKQIVGSSLRDSGDQAQDNFVSELDAAFYASLYRKKGIKGGHVILLNPSSSEFYEKTLDQAMKALAAYPGGLQVGGGITADNALDFLNAGASHVIVTSYVFRDGRIHYGNLKKLAEKTGRNRLVLDLSCRKRDDGYYIVTDRWQKFTDEKLCPELLDHLCACCDEFLIHAVDAEGKQQGIERQLAAMLGEWGKIPITYAGGIRSFDDLREIRKLGRGKIHATIGSALSLFGGTMDFEQVLSYCRSEETKEG